jgi:hypothetical protein
MKWPRRTDPSARDLFSPTSDPAEDVPLSSALLPESTIAASGPLEPAGAPPSVESWRRRDRRC